MIHCSLQVFVAAASVLICHLHVLCFMAVVWLLQKHFQSLFSAKWLQILRAIVTMSLDCVLYYD